MWCLNHIGFTMLLVHLLAWCHTAHAQAPYLGGNGDGYDSRSHVFAVDWNLDSMDSLKVFPTSLVSGELLHVMVQKPAGKLEVQLHTLGGTLVGRQTQWDISGLETLDIPTTGWSGGLYVVEVRCDGQVKTCKILVKEK